MAGNVSGLHVFAADTGPEALSLLDTNYGLLTTAFNTLQNFSNSYIDSGALNTLVVTVPAPQVFSYTDGVTLQVKVGSTNTSTAPTINVNGLGAKTIVNPDGTALALGAMTAGGWCTLTYETGIGKFQLIDSSSGATGIGKFADGSVTNPSITFGTDLSTGLYRIGTGTIGITTSGVNRGNINATGNWTLATPSAGRTLLVNAFSGSPGIELDGASGSFASIQLKSGLAGNRSFELISGNTADRFDIFDDTLAASRFSISASTNAMFGYGPVTAGLVDMTPDTSTFNGTFTGGTGFPASTCRWARSGNMVTLAIGSGTGTSNAGTFTMTGLPAAIQPTRSMQMAIVTATDGSSLVSDVTATITGGTVTFQRNGAPAGWTNTGTKGFTGAFGPVLTYPLN